MPKLDFHRFEVLSFDCYGTLIDWERGILDAVKPVLSNHKIVAADETILETYAQIESEAEAGPYQSYRHILRTVMIRMSKRFGFVPDNTECNAIVASLPNWPPFEDTVAALKALQSRFRLAIISNVDDDLFAGTNRHLGVEFDYIITAAQVGAYKPSPKVFEYALGKIGCDKSKLLHLAQSLYHDHVPAKRLGLSTVWINRRQGKAGSGATLPADATPDAQFPDLASLVRAMGV
jgi:2-haloacid dehalogenase